MLQIFDCASIIGWCLQSHDAAETLLVSQLRRTDIDHYRLPSKSIINPQRECQSGASDRDCASGFAVLAVPSCLIVCRTDFRIKQQTLASLCSTGGELVLYTVKPTLLRFSLGLEMQVLLHTVSNHHAFMNVLPPTGSCHGFLNVHKCFLRRIGLEGSRDKQRLCRLTS